MFSMAATEHESVNILVESADTVAKAVYSSDKGEHYKTLLTTDVTRTNASKIQSKQVIPINQSLLMFNRF